MGFMDAVRGILGLHLEVVPHKGTAIGARMACDRKAKTNVPPVRMLTRKFIISNL